MLLDQVQKRHPIDRSAAARLRRERLVEGRYPNLYVAAHVAAAAGDMAQYIRNRAFDDQHYKTMIVEYIRQYGQASRADVDRLLANKLSDVLSDSQKINKIKNLLGTMARDGLIRNEGTQRKSRWVLV